MFEHIVKDAGVKSPVFKRKGPIAIDERSPQPDVLGEFHREWINLKTDDTRGESTQHTTAYSGSYFHDPRPITPGAQKQER
jgi:hypothetical protein